MEVHGAFDLSQGGDQTIGTLLGDGRIYLGTHQLTSGGAANSTFSGVISDGGIASTLGFRHQAMLSQPTGGSFVKTGSGILVFTGVNTYTGGTTVAEGTLALANGGKLAATGAVKVVGTFDISGGGNQTIGDLFGTGTVALGRNQITLGTAGDSTFAGILQDDGLGGGTGGSVVKQGAGALTLTGISTYTGGTLISQGTVIVSGLGSLPATGTIVNNGILDLTNAANQSIGNLIGSGTVKLGASDFDFGGSGSSLYSGVLSGSGAFVKQGSGVVTLTGDSTSTGPVKITDGALQVGNGGTTGSLGTGPITNNAMLVFNRSNTLIVTSLISGTGTLGQIGTGTTILTAANTYTGPTIIDAGTLQIGNGGATANIGTGPISNNSALAVKLSGSTVISAPISGIGSLTVSGGGTTVLTGSNSYTGLTSILNSTLQIGDGGQLGSLGNGRVVDNGTLIFKSAAAFTVANAISGTGSFTQAGIGIIRMGSQSYTGATIISKGQLVVNGTLATSLVNIGLGTTLSGYAAIAGSVANDGIISPGDRIGRISIGGNYLQSSRGILQLELASPLSYDSLQVKGRVTLGGTLAVGMTGTYLPRLGQTFQVVTAGKGIGGRFANISSGAGARG